MVKDVRAGLGYQLCVQSSPGRLAYTSDGEWG